MSILALILGGYALICLGVFLLQSRLVYFPEAELIGTPQEIGLAYRDVEFRADDGVELHGWLVPASDGDTTTTGEEANVVSGTPVVLFCHGNAGNISGRLSLIQIMNGLGLSVFIFDYRGYGRSQGSPSESGTYLDAHAAWRHLTETEGLPPDRILLWGRSIGGAVAIELAGRVNPRALIVDSSFTSAVDLGAQVYRWLPVRLLARIRYDSSSRVGSLSMPKLFIHSRSDSVVPFAMGRRLFAEASEPKEFLEIRGEHNDGFLVSQGEYRDGVGEFLSGIEPTTQ
jgi:fermentation-respiration switch protein FrsA (DUF1100 family)